MAAYRRVYDSHHLQADCQEPDQLRNPTLGSRVWAIPDWLNLLLAGIYTTQPLLFCSVLQPSSIGGLAAQSTYFLHLSLSSVILTDSSTESPVHVLMMSIHLQPLHLLIISINRALYHFNITNYYLSNVNCINVRNIICSTVFAV